MKKILWEFDMLIYKLFYWRWDKRLRNDPNLRQLFLKYLIAYDTIDKEPAMGIGDPPKFPYP